MGKGEDGVIPFYASRQCRASAREVPGGWFVKRPVRQVVAGCAGEDRALLEGFSAEPSGVLHVHNG